MPTAPPTQLTLTPTKPWAIVHAPPERVQQLTGIYGAPRVPIQSDEPQLRRMSTGIRLCYELDLTRTGAHEMARLTVYTSSKFNITLDTARELIRNETIALIADDCTVEYAE